MKLAKPFFTLFALLSLFSCGGPGVKNLSSSFEVKLPPTEQGFVDQFRHAKVLISDGLDHDRKKFLEDSMKNSIDEWLSNKTGLKANRWLGVVMNDTVGQSFSNEQTNVLQLYLPVTKASDTTGARYNFAHSITLTMSVDEDDQDMVKARRRLSDGDTVVFSGYFTPMSKQVPDMVGNPGDFLMSPSLDFTPTELYKKGTPAPPARPEPDTLGLAKAPVKVTARMTIKRISGGRFVNFKVTVKNISGKPITRSTVQWFVVNKNGRPAKVDGATGIWLLGHFNQELAPGETETEEWEHESPDGEKVQFILPKLVTFYNGMKWRIGNH